MNDAGVNGTAAAALNYRRRGWRPIPVGFRAKKPMHAGWRNLDVNEDQIPAFFGPSPCNIGLRLGAPSNGLVDVDLDCPQAIALADMFLPSTMTFGRTSTPRSHRLFITPNAPQKTKRYRAPDGATLVELRSTGGQTVVPPSIHEKGEPITWYGNVTDPIEISTEELTTRVAGLAAASLMARHWPEKGSRQDTALALAGFLLTNKMNPVNAEYFIRVVAETAGDDEIRMRQDTVACTVSKIANGEPVIGRAALVETLGKDVVKALGEWLGFRGMEGDGFVRNTKDAIVHDNQSNIRHALDLLGVSVSYDSFANRLLLARGDAEPAHLDDQALIRVWLEVDEKFRFRPGYEFFQKVVEDRARANSFHPVRDYLDGLAWDGTKRLDAWLIDYAGAGDSKYTRAIGALVLIAAVRRVREPGCKFDELLVLESDQGTDKSSALAALCPKARWFSDDLPLACGAKETIERTAGKWIIEASELSGMAKRDVEQLKASLSRQVDNARLAYGRLNTERRREFILIGTTNSNAYLKDSTGNRRFWPVCVQRFDVDHLRADRDQLWAEAAHRERNGESIRLDPSLYTVAKVQQERRRVEDPWQEQIACVVGRRNGKIWSKDAWLLVGLFDPARRTQNDNDRLGQAMRANGFERRKKRFDGEPDWGYSRGTQEEQEKRICVGMQLDKFGRPVPGGAIAAWMEGENAPYLGPPPEGDPM